MTKDMDELTDKQKMKYIMKVIDKLEQEKLSLEVAIFGLKTQLMMTETFRKEQMK